MRLAAVADLIVASEDVVGHDLVDDLGGRDAVHLVFEAFAVVRIRIAHAFVAVEPFDNLSDVQAGLHVQVCERVGRIVEADWVLLFEHVHHLHDHATRGEDLVGLLRRHVVEDVLP